MWPILEVLYWTHWEITVCFLKSRVEEHGVPFVLEYFHMRGEINSHRYEISFWLKISLRRSVSSLLALTWIKLKPSWISYLFFLTEMKFQTIIIFSCEKKLPEVKWITADSLGIALMRMFFSKFHAVKTNHCLFGYRHHCDYMFLQH